MKTIGAKEFRLHMNEVLDRVLQGEEIVVQHRLKGPVRLSAVRQKPSNGVTGLQAFDTAAKKPSPYDPHKNLKDLYHDSLTKKY
jgi:antitoxin (DNA-binding transcriptional repressor) of toxin-antitoxin stability system